MNSPGKTSHAILVGSPRADGRCARYATDLAAREANAQLLSVAGLRIAGCTGCEACRAWAPEIRCAFDDDMGIVYRALSEARCVTVAAPLYFAGPPSQLKALLDRLQPHFWAETRKLPKRPARLVVFGEGGDPHGAEPLVTIVRSALAVAGFKLEDVEVRVTPDG